MEFDAPLLSHLQATAALAAQSVLPSFTIGLASWLAVLEGLWLGVGNETFRRLYRTWIPAFAAVFGAAVAAALATPPATRLQLILELIAFVLEAGLVGVMLFRWRPRARVSHFAATVVLAVGSVLFAATWPGASGPVNLARLLLSAYLATAVLVAAVAAWRLMSDTSQDDSCTALKMAIGMFVICAPLQIAADADAGLGRPMMGLGLALACAVLVVGLWGGLLTWRGSPERSRLFLRACVALAPLSVLTAVTGWSGLESAS
jgi:cytochrome d ubiquinol oxidase subunit I